MPKAFFVFFLLHFAIVACAQNTSTTTGQSAAGQSDHRSLDDTTQSIQRELETNSGATYRITSGAGENRHTWRSNNTYHDFRFTGCEMAFVQDHQMNAGDVRQIRYTVPLWDIASVTYKLDDGDHSGDKNFHYTPMVPSLWIVTRSNSIHWTKPNTFFPTNQAEIEFGHDLTTKENKNLETPLNRLAAAFMHAADLCASQAPGTSPSEPAATPTP